MGFSGNAVSATRRGARRIRNGCAPATGKGALHGLVSRRSSKARRCVRGATVSCPWSTSQYTEDLRGDVPPGASVATLSGRGNGAPRISRKCENEIGNARRRNEMRIRTTTGSCVMPGSTASRSQTTRPCWPLRVGAAPCAAVGPKRTSIDFATANLSDDSLSTMITQPGPCEVSSAPLVTLLSGTFVTA